MNTPRYQAEHGLLLIDDPSDPAKVWYAPAAPSPERGPNGAPAVTVVLAGATRLLTLGALLQADDAAVARASGARQLHPCPLQAVAAQVTITATGGGRDVLGVSTTSGYPPYHAVFSLSLDEAAASQATAALAGGTEHLFVTYQVTLAVPGTKPLPVKLDGDVGTWFAGTDSSPVVIG
jgi:hypothetical protein